MTHLTDADSPGDIRLSVGISINDKNKHLLRKLPHLLYMTCVKNSNYLVLANNTPGLELLCTVLKDYSLPVAFVCVKVFLWWANVSQSV